jgi:hypothetical protein
MERAIRRTLGVTTLAASAAVAGCAGAGTTAARGSASAPASATAAASRTASPAPATTPRQRAVTDAAAILTAFVPPPGARRLQKAPGTDGGLLKSPSSIVVSTALVDDVSFWLAPGQPPAVLAWERAHLPRRFTPEDEGSGPAVYGVALRVLGYHAGAQGVVPSERVVASEAVLAPQLLESS